MLENLKVQDALEECKVVRRPIIRYIQVRPETCDKSRHKPKADVGYGRFAGRHR